MIEALLIACAILSGACYGTMAGDAISNQQKETSNTTTIIIKSVHQNQDGYVWYDKKWREYVSQGYTPDQAYAIMTYVCTNGREWQGHILSDGKQ